MPFVFALARLLACGCLAAASASAQVALPSGDGMSVDERVSLFAAREARMRNRIEWAIFDDAAMRAEVGRIGFARGCELVDRAGKEVVERHAAVLEAEIAEAIRETVPAERIAQARIMSFLVSPLTAYRGRFEKALEEGAADALTAAKEDMRRTFLAASTPLPSTANPADDEVAPKPDMAASLGLEGSWDLDRPEQLSLACAEHRISPRLRPTITTTGTPQR